MLFHIFFQISKCPIKTLLEIRTQRADRADAISDRVHLLVGTRASIMIHMLQKYVSRFAIFSSNVSIFTPIISNQILK